MHAVRFLLSLTCVWLLAASALAAPGSKEAPPLTTEDTSARPTLTQDKAAIAAEETGGHVGLMGILSSNVNFDGQALFDMLLLQGEVHWTHPSWRFVAHPRLKVRPLGTESDTPSVFIQEMYGSFRHGAVAELKVGKIYEQFGRMWDYGVYGPLTANLDLKLRPDIGLSLEGAPQVAPKVSLEYALQYFAVDGQTLRVTSGWQLQTNARHTNIVVGRIAPALDVDDVGTFGVGLSGKRYTSFGDDRAGHQVLTVAADLSFNRGPLDAFVEAGYQNAGSAALGAPTNNYSTTDTVDAYTYLWAGASYDVAAFNFRFNYSASFYRDAPGSVEMLYQPGIGYFIGDNRELQVAVEGAFWSSTNPMARAESAPGWQEQAVYLVAVGHI